MIVLIHAELKTFRSLLPITFYALIIKKKYERSMNGRLQKKN
ncbi:hypothetical protein BTJ45_02338 [Bacillus mycoides]|nr:hypothetical protein BTJ45_02338 [Bacillus mycoides]